MNAKHLVAFVLPIAAVAAVAQPFGQHPALSAVRAPAGIDASTFVVGHPASPTTRGGHANFEHPAVVVARQRAAIDPNTFIVQPPVQVTWTDGAAAAAATLAQR